MRCMGPTANTLTRRAYTVNVRQQSAVTTGPIVDELRESGRGPRLALERGVRSLVLAVAMLAAGGWGVVHLCSGDAAAAPPAAALAPNGPSVIAGIAFDARGVATAELRALLASRPGLRLDTATLGRDRDALHDALVARGYLAARVAAPAVTRDAAGAAFVTFAIAQGPLYRVRSVAVHGASAVEVGPITLAAGDVAQADRIAAARVALADRLRRGTVTANVTADDAHAAVDVELAVAPSRTRDDRR